MSYILTARNKNVNDISFGAFTWPIMLQDSGMGYVINYGSGKTIGTYVYAGGNNGSPSSNDGYKVTAYEAKAMALVARGYVFVQRHVNKDYEGLSDKEIEDMKNESLIGTNRPRYRSFIHEDHLKKYELFADFAEKSGGFTIN